MNEKFSRSFGFLLCNLTFKIIRETFYVCRQPATAAAEINPSRVLKKQSIILKNLYLSIFKDDIYTSHHTHRNFPNL